MPMRMFYRRLPAPGRARLLLKELKGEMPPDERLRRLTPVDQAEELNEYLVLVTVANFQFPGLIAALALVVENHWQAYEWLGAERALREEIAELRQRAGVRGKGRVQPQINELDLKRAVTETGRELAVVAAVLEDLSRGMGEDVLKPETRRVLDEAMESVSYLEQKLGGKGSWNAEPRLVQELQRFVAKGFAILR